MASRRPWGDDAPDLYERMEVEARTEVHAPRTAFMLFGEAGIIFLGFLMLGYVLYAAQFSGLVRWSLGFTIVAVLAFYAFTRISRVTVEPAPLVTRTREGAPLQGELGYFTSVMRRAEGGLAYSQVLASSRARDAFLERTRLARGLSPEGMRALAASPAELRDTVHDDLLADFLYLPSQDLEARYRWVREVREGGGFDASFRKVLDRMEAWR